MPTPTSALILGASDVYPLLGSTLQSCCMDNKSMYDWYGNKYAMSGSPFLAFENQRFTKELMFAGARALLKNNPGIKRCAIPISSHGTTIPKNGVNHAAIVFANATWDDLDTFGFDTDFAQLFSEFPGVNFYFTADACESANLAFRLASTGQNKAIAPPSDLQMMIDHNNASGAAPRSLAPQVPNCAYVSGTGGKGFYSMDEGDGGAFTKTWTRLVTSDLTGGEIAELLDNNMDSLQQPQAHGALAGQKWFS